jgi:hypothetical protein
MSGQAGEFQSNSVFDFPAWPGCAIIGNSFFLVGCIAGRKLEYSAQKLTRLMEKDRCAPMMV